jgi:hypothetical protein
VDKERFIKVLHHFSGSSVEEAQEVLSLKDSFPYSQLLHVLSARVAKDHGFSTHGGELQLAAVYAADRAVLKEIMQREYAPETTLSGAVDIAPATVLPTLQAQPVQTATSTDFATELLHDLERLHELKQNFELMFTDDADAPSGVIVNDDVQDGEPETREVNEPETREVKKESSKSKKERIIALAKALEAAKTEQEEESSAGQKTRKKRKDNGEELIDEIASSKQELEPESEKQKEQLEMIDHFIKIQPTIVNSKDKPLPPPAGDLSTLKTGEFGDNIVSETLVEILIKQGKKDKAVEVLKKLIWKFPQKKAYFAAQIEDLRK